MAANLTLLGSFRSRADVPAVSTDPYDLALLRKNPLRLCGEIFHQSLKALLMPSFDFCNPLKQSGDFVIPLLLGLLFVPAILVAPLAVLLAHRLLESLEGRRLFPVKLFVPDLGVLLLVLGCLLKNGGDLLQALFLGKRGKVVVFRADAALGGKRLEQVGIGFALCVQIHGMLLLCFFIQYSLKSPQLFCFKSESSPLACNAAVFFCLQLISRTLWAALNPFS
jgi:hypothetical protein